MELVGYQVRRAVPLESGEFVYVVRFSFRQSLAQEAMNFISNFCLFHSLS